MGSHGDVEPFLALAAGLRRRDHTVVVATHAEFAALVTGAGAEFAELGGNPPPRPLRCPPEPAFPAPAARGAEALTWRAFRPRSTSGSQHAQRRPRRAGGGARRRGARAGHRMVLHSGWSELREAGREGLVGDDVLVVDDVPHAWLLPRMGAVVLHGRGHHRRRAAAGARRGDPALRRPVLLGGRVAALAAGAPPIPRERLTDARLPTPSPTPSAVATGPGASRRRWRRRTASPRPSTCSKPAYDGTARAAATVCAVYERPNSTTCTSSGNSWWVGTRVRQPSASGAASS